MPEMKYVDMNILKLIRYNCIQSQGGDFLLSVFINEMEKINIGKIGAMIKIRSMLRRNIIDYDRDDDNIYYLDFTHWGLY